jgi:hypothetical protein
MVIAKAVGETPTAAVETTALPKKSPRFGGLLTSEHRLGEFRAFQSVVAGEQFRTE